MSRQRAFRDELRRDIADRKVAVLLGTGVTAALSGGAPHSTWKSLIADGLRFFSEGNTKNSAENHLRTLADSPSTADLIASAEWIAQQFGDTSSGEYRSWLNRTIGRLPRGMNPTLAMSLPQVDFVLTTNYDDTWLDAYPNRSPLTWNAENAVTRYARDSADYVFHLHGHYKTSDSVILSGQDYGKLNAHDTTFRVLQQVANGNSLCLIGCGGTKEDPSIGRFIDWLRTEQRQSPNRHYMLMTNEDLQNFDQSRDFYDSRLTPVAYGDQHEDLQSFLSELFSNGSFGALTASRSQNLPDGSVKTTDTPRIEEIHSIEIKKFANGALLDQEELLIDPHNIDEGYASLLGFDLPVGFAQQIRETLGPEEKLNQFQKATLVAFSDAIKNRSSALVCAVTGTGKTTLARVAMNMAVAQRSSAVGLYPTKAIVTQEKDSWTSWQQYWEATLGRSLGLYPASRDYPDSDAPVSRGQFDVTIAISEKLGIYLVNGRSPLNSTVVVVVDELQILAEGGERASRLEAVLTLIKLMKPEDRPALIGLSPSLGLDATSMLRSWWGVSDSALLSSNERPIPLDTYVVDSIGWRKQSDAHLLNIDGKDAPDPAPYEEHGLNERQTKNAKALQRLSLPTSAGILASTLVDFLMERDSSARILCFVSSRRAARDLALAIQKLAEQRMPTMRKGSPWTVGRFASSRDNIDTQRKYAGLSNSDIPGVELILRGLRHGIAPHSAEFAPALRKIVEEEFLRDDGILRVLVATDTLAMGINLPADIVVATTISGYSDQNNEQQLLTPENLDNKAGRAGRLGVSRSPRGEFYLLAPSASELKKMSLTQAERDTLSRANGVFDRYVRGPRKSLEIRSNYRTRAQVAALVLQVLCVDGHARMPDQLKARIQDIRESLLLSQEVDIDIPSAETLTAELTTRRLIAERANGKVGLTGLGHALARSSLELDLAETLERVARLACANAGPIDLLWNTCRSTAIQTATRWVSLPPVFSRHLPSMKDAVIEIANAYCADSIEQRRTSAARMQGRDRKFPDELVEAGSPVVSEELRRLLGADGETASDGDITALLRSIVAYEWSKGISFGQMQRRLQNAIVSDEKPRDFEMPPKVRLHYSDVEQLCEQVAGVLRGAAEIAVGEDRRNYGPDLSGLAGSVESGWPSWLAPIKKLRYDWLHRETLTFLWNKDVPNESLSEIFHLEQLRSRTDIPSNELDEAASVIYVREQEERLSRTRISKRWATEPIPGGDGATFGDMSDRVETCDRPQDYLDAFNEFLEDLGIEIEVILPSDYFLHSRWKYDGQFLDIAIPTSPLTAEAVQSAVTANWLVLLTTTLTPPGRQALKAPSYSRYVDPENLLEAIAKSAESIGATYDARDAFEVVSCMTGGDGESDGWFVMDGPISAPPPFSGPLPSLAEIVGLAGAAEEVNS